MRSKSIPTSQKHPYFSESIVLFTLMSITGARRVRRKVFLMVYSALHRPILTGPHHHYRSAAVATKCAYLIATN